MSISWTMRGNFPPVATTLLPWQIRMMNNGLDTLTSATIEVSKLLPFNATEVIGTVDWEGELGTYDFTTVSLMDVIMDGSTTYVFNVVTEDDNMANNSTSGYVRASEEVTNNLRITLKTDGAPEQLDGNCCPKTEMRWHRFFRGQRI